MQDIHTIIDALNLEPHPEGGFYKEMHRSMAIIQDLNDLRDKSAYTSIYYLPANTWFSAKPLSEATFCLVSCAVAPGFEFTDFEIAKRKELIREFGTSANSIQAIEALTRS